MCCDLRDLSASAGRCKLRLMRSCTRALQVLMNHVGKEKQALQQLTTLLFTTIRLYRRRGFPSELGGLTTSHKQQEFNIM